MVSDGQVADFQRNKTVSVKAGHSYLARATRAASKKARKKGRGGARNRRAPRPYASRG